MSHEISMEWREYERTSTAVLNAYVQPGRRATSDASSERSSERDRRTLVHHAVERRHGVVRARRSRRPITMVESGPVGGVIGAAVIGEAIGEPNMITLDIGGTTAKCSLIENGEVQDRPPSTDRAATRQRRLPDQGAGGRHRRDRRRRRLASPGSTPAARCSVGPQSAGADPGPACYGRGGTEPTVTDANLIAGPDRSRLLPRAARSRSTSSCARKAIEQDRGRRSGVSVEDAALGVIRIANANMVNALKLVSVRRGYDPREFDMVAFGGGGSMHAARWPRAADRARDRPPCPATSRPGAC